MIEVSANTLKLGSESVLHLMLWGTRKTLTKLSVSKNLQLGAGEIAQ